MSLRKMASFAALGSMLGGLAGALQPPDYESRVTLHFPSVQPLLLANLTQALRAQPEVGSNLPTQFSGNPDVSQMAILILRSQAAAEFALDKVGQNSAGRWGDPVGGFQSGLQVEAADPSTLVVRVRSRSASRAKDSLTGLLEYYVSFSHKTPLTRVRQARELSEDRLTKVRKELSRLEDQLSRSTSKELRSLGDASTKVNPKVMSEVWMRRVDEEGRGRDLLNKMQKVRGRSAPADPDEKWLAEWAAGRKLDVRYSKGLLHAPVRRQDVLERARLERNYYEALLKHRSLVLQHSFLLTWEALENPDFEIIDPVRVSSLRTAIFSWVLWGGLGGAVVGLLVWGWAAGASGRSSRNSP